MYLVLGSFRESTSLNLNFRPLSPKLVNDDIIVCGQILRISKNRLQGRISHPEISLNASF